MERLWLIVTLAAMRTRDIKGAFRRLRHIINSSPAVIRRRIVREVTFCRLPYLADVELKPTAAGEMERLSLAAREALTDNIVERWFMFLESMVNTVGNEAMGELAENTRLALEEAAQETSKAAPPKGGMISTLSLLSKPETQRGLAFLLAFSSKLQGLSSGPVPRL